MPKTAGSNYVNANPPAWIARSDYAGNSGDGAGYDHTGPTSESFLTKKDAEIDAACLNGPNVGINSNGATYQRSECSAAMLKDGASKTYLCGERHVNVKHYENGSGIDDNEGWDTGYNNDTYRWTHVPPVNDINLANTDRSEAFGSAHLMTFNMAFCDGSVKAIPFEVNNNLHRVLGNRKDGQQFGGQSYDMSSLP